MSRHHKKTVIALSHYYKHPSGDMIADPDMTIAVYSANEMGEAIVNISANFFLDRETYHLIQNVTLRLGPRMVDAAVFITAHRLDLILNSSQREWKIDYLKRVEGDHDLQLTLPLILELLEKKSAEIG